MIARKRWPYVCRHVALLVLAWGLLARAVGQEAPRADPWEAAIQAFEARDRAAPPPQDALLFLGSSSIRLWKLDESFPDLPVINRGFGGSEIADSVRFTPRIVLPYKPRLIVFYAGDNDVAKGKTSETVLADFQALVRVVHETLPDTRIAFIAIKPSLKRWNLVGTMREANALVRAFTETDKRLAFIDVDAPMIAPDGRPRPELLLEDGLHLNAEGYTLWTSLVRPHLDAALAATKPGRLRVATCQFPVWGDVAANGEWVRRQMREGRAQGADVVHFPECALSGYAGVDVKTMERFDWIRQREEMDAILALAKELGVWVVLGAAHPLSGDHKPHDAVYVISPEGRVVDRYDKRFCTGGDLEHYSPGDHFVTFDVNGVKCGVLICYDIRFPELYRQYCKQGVQVMFHSFYNARQKPGGIHPKIMPPTAQARAATNYMFISMNNSSAPHSWASVLVTPDGLIERRLPLDEPGVMVSLVDTDRRYYDASRPYRLDAINGRWNSGELVDDARSKDRQSY